jgi:SAM-dependent methyltransferase
MTNETDDQSKKVRDFYNKIAPVFDDLYGDADGKFLNDYEEYEDRLLKQWIGSMVLTFSEDEPIEVLDLGCGTGYGAEVIDAIAHATKRNLSYKGIDIAEEMIKEAKDNRAREGYCFEVADILDPSQYERNRYRIIFSLYASLGHVDDISQAMQNSFNALHAQGHFFFMTYSRYSLKNIFNYISKFDSDALKRNRDYKIRGFDGEELCPAYFSKKDELEKDLRKSGFEIVSVQGMNTPLSSILSNSSSKRVKSIGFGMETKLLSLFPSLGHYLVFHCKKTEAACEAEIPILAQG